MNEKNPTPPGRKAIAIILLVGGLTLYSLLMVFLLADLNLPQLAKLPIYALAGIAWIFPCRNLLMWMETGTWALPKKQK
jgi:Protein of unknown function (DUF2842)